MRKTIAFILGVALLAVALSQTACKPRDAKKFAMALGPKISANPCAIPQYVRAISEDEHCMTIYGDTSGKEPVFNPGDMNAAGQDVYSFTIPYGMWVYITGCPYSGSSNGATGQAVVFNPEIGFSIRDNCDPDGDMISVGGGSPCASSSEYLEAGTYYVVVSTSEGYPEYYFYISSDLCSGYHYEY
jgi:hypothetical protein